MKNIITILFVLFLAITNLTAQEWQTDFTKAKEIAKKENKTVVLIFQGSDWCAPCIKLSENIIKTDVFINYAKEHYVLLKADFARSKKNKVSKEQANANAKMFEKYNPNGIFPFVVVMDSMGKVLGETGYKKLSPKEYIDQLNKFI